MSAHHMLLTQMSQACRVRSKIAVMHAFSALAAQRRIGRKVLGAQSEKQRSIAAYHWNRAIKKGIVI